MSTNNEIIRAIGKLEGKCDQIIGALDKHYNRMNRIDKDIKMLGSSFDEEITRLETRVGHLEKKQYVILTIAAGLGSLIMIAINKLV